MEHEYVKFMFWNIHHRSSNLERSLRYGNEKQIDVMAFCEMPKEYQAVELYGYYQIKHIDTECEDIAVFVRDFNEQEQQCYYREKKHFSLLRLNKYRINLLVMHLNSQMYDSGESRVLDIGLARSDIKWIESKYKDKNTLIIGDMNTGLFDDEMLSFHGFNACLFKYEVDKRTRSLHGEKQDLLYNPMLQVYKDNTDKSMPKGTYFYGRKSPYWYCFDHVLMKPELVPRFKDDSLLILDRLGDYPLIINHKPNKEASDHMPIQFELEVSK